MARAARYVEDVDKDPMVLFDGLTKNWRYPGWRVTWTVGPRRSSRRWSSAGSFLDGGGSKPLQRAALPLFEPGLVRQEQQAIHDAFRPKRDRMLQGLKALGIGVAAAPEATFYVWGDLRASPAAPERWDGAVPGGARPPRHHRAGRVLRHQPRKAAPRAGVRFRGHARFSFGPSMEVVERALERLADVVRARAA